jgi:DNA-binding transcriptional LysR family regulator
MHRLRTLLGPLRVLDAVYRSGGVANAAQALHVTPGAVGQQLKNLESGLNVALFSRKEGRELAFTERGERLALSIADAFNHIEGALAEVSDDGQANRLRMKVHPSLAIKWLMPRLASFYASHNDIDVEVGTTSRPSDWQLDQCDLGIRHGTGDWSDVEFDHLFDDSLVPVCSPQMAAGIRSPSDLLGQCLLHSMMRRDAWNIWFTSTGIAECASARGLTLANAALCYEAAAEGVGVAMAQMAYVHEDLRSGRLIRPVDHVATTDTGYYLVCDPAKANSRAVKAFRAWIRTSR